MRWEELTAPEFAEAVRSTATCILAMGVLERHSDHLPLGTDVINAHTIACLAAEREPAVVFPPFYFGQIYEARCFPGAVTLRPTLLLDLLQGVLDEIGRNGFTKIVIYNGHGGNNHLLPFLAQCALWEERPYTVYLPTMRLTPERQQEQARIIETAGGHAGESETSMVLANRPDLVRLEAIPDIPGLPKGRMRHLPPTFSAVSWYADYPEHYAGDAHYASREKGLRLRELLVATLAEYIAAVKADTVAPALGREFHARARGMTQSLLEPSPSDE
ncbi:MAG: creatininase family protein [Chloroflexi bacterium]|nr:creatininase family protein [Chloroflexota bacterium]